MASQLEMKGGIISGEAASKYVEGMLHEGKQIKDRGIDLTLKEVYILEGPGNLDFSGKESKPGRLRRHPLLKRGKDPYGWWALGGGHYVIEFNEKLSLPENAFALVAPRPELAANEAHHPTMVLNPGDDLGLTTLTVGPPGINLKQNARMSRLSIIMF